jgi:hypothetical protein
VTDCRLIKCLSLLAASFAGGRLMAVTIDDFSAGAFSLEVLRHENDSVTITGLPPNNTLGGSRFVTLYGAGPSPESSVRVSVETAFSELHYDADPGATATNFVVGYGYTTSLQANLLSDGANSLVFDFAFADFEPGLGYFDIVVTTQPGGKYLYVPVANSSVPFSLVLPYRAFGTNTNFANVSKINIGTGNGNLRGDFALAGIRTAYYSDGDFNFDGSVDGQDYAVWSSHFGNFNFGYPVDPADGNRDGRVDTADYVLWRAALPEGTADSPPTSVPEAGQLAILVSALVILLSLRRAYRFR